MPATAIKLNNLSKTFSKGKNKVDAVKAINLTVDAGQVFGFLGPNGAGKSSTIRMMMNLLYPTAGEIEILGQNLKQHPDILQRVGALVEGAKFYEFLTGRKNLEILATLSHVPDQSVIDRLLAQMDLSDRADRKVKGYSTGMRQRLGIAAAMLHDPDLIILDEPTNGLDPAGIQEIRLFIRQLVDEFGKTVFLSSHMLGEVEQVCDQVAIISEGKILRQGKVESLLAEQESIKLEVYPIEQATAVLQPTYPVEQTGKWLIVQLSHEETPALINTLVQHNINIHQVVAQQQSLEAFFMAVTKKVME